MRRLIIVLPVAIVLLLLGFFAWRLVLMQRGDTPDLIPSAMLGKPAPSFDLPALKMDEAGLRSADLPGQVTLVNFFASWCPPCRVEHPLLVELAGTGKLRLVGIAYKDKPEDTLAWLGKLGNPYQALAVDQSGRAAIDFGVYGVPESYLIDRAGVIRFRQVGPFSQDDIQRKLLPLVAELSR